MNCQKNTARLPRMKNTRSKIKPIETGKEIGTTYCLGCKNYTHNFKPQEVKMINKVLREKSNSVVCRSSKSSKTKIQKKNNFSDNIIVQIVFTSHKNIQIYYKNCKKHTGNTFPKKLVLISKHEMKGKSKYVIFLTKRIFTK